jgi:hypothetical protein
MPTIMSQRDTPRILSKDVCRMLETWTCTLVLKLPSELYSRNVQ